ncbi:MAG: transporter substrate-binding domain-containing protein, partial [Atopobiaceae bacterium]|nr:transporter substrate-binding domain-containing protein [Atopobiaceae bacterium]
MTPLGSKATQGTRRFLRTALCLVLLMCALLSTLAFADDDHKTVRVGYYKNEVFQEGASEGAVKTGYAYEYYRKLSEYTGWEYEYVYGDYVDLYQQLIDGKVDLLAGLAWREDRVDLMLYPHLAMGNETYSIVKHTDDESVTIEPKTLDGKRIGVLDSAVVGVLNGFLETNDVDAEVVPMRSYEAVYEAFEAGEVDVVAVERDGSYSRDDMSVLYSFGASDYYLCVNKGRPDLLAELNEAQAQLQEDEPSYISELRSKYYPVSMASRSFSASEKEWLSTHDSLCVGYLNHYLPYSDTGGDGNPTGIIKDIIPRMLGSLGLPDITVTYVGYESYDEIIADMAAGTIDVAFPVGGGLYYSEENGIYQSNVVVSSTTELVYRGDYRDDITDHFAVNENNRMQYYYVKTNFPDAEITLYP